MKLALIMPQFGESITEALIVRWLKQEGEEVVEKEPLLELETEKSVFSYESPFKGRLTKIFRKGNEQVAVGAEIAQFEVEDSLAKKYLSLGIGKGAGEGPPGAAKILEQPLGPPLSAAAMPPGVRGIPPLIRSMAKEKGIPFEELEKLSGTGPEGRLTKEDFLRYLEKRTKRGMAGPETKEIPLAPIRARIAEKMSLSKRMIPHAGTGVDVDVSLIEEWRTKNRSPYGYLPFVLCAVPPALKKYPVLNNSFQEKDGRQWIEEHNGIHLGIATATAQGLLVPVLKDADRLTFGEIAARGTELIEKARAGRLDLSELTGGTFTVNNTGALGAIRSQQIIPYPQSGILAVNRVVKRPWVVANQIVIRSILSLDLAFDHRLVDGDAAVGFLEELRRQLENFDFTVVG